VTRFVVDATAAIHIARSGVQVASGHELLAPTLLRSQTLNALREAVHRGELAPDEARDLIGRVGPPGLKIRLLGDAVLRRVAWEIAEQQGWQGTYDAEYLALTRLQGDALVTLDAGLARSAEGIVPLAPIDAIG
jgi:indolepyruvate ferredoxin oxidoreductase alpha subunit